MNALNEMPALRLGEHQVVLGELLRRMKVNGHLRSFDDAVNDWLIDAGAEEAGIWVSDDELQQAADAFRQRHGLHKAQDTRQWLDQQGLAQEDLERRIEHGLLADKLKAHVTEGKIEQYFAEHRAEFESATLFQIVVAGQELAEELRSQLAEGEAELSALARSHSIDARSAAQGGFVGTLARTALNPALEAAVFGAEPGALLGPLQTDQGWHVVKVENIDRSGLDERKRELIRNRLFAAYLHERRQQARPRLTLFEQLPV